jgi:peroxiredoxin
MKKSHLILIFTVLLAGTAYLAVSSSPKGPQGPATEVPSQSQLEVETATAPASVLPNYTLSDIKGKTNAIHDLAGDKPTLFIYFSSTCHLCQDELGAISKRIEEFDEYNLIFTTVQPIEEIMGFVTGLGIKDRSNVHFLLDSEMQVAAHLQIRSVPSIFVYGVNKELVANYVGITEVDLLKEKLAQGK